MFGGDILISAFLLLNAFILGAAVAIGYTHARAHFQHEAPPVAAKKDLPILPLAVQQRMAQDAEDDYQEVLKRSTSLFEKDLHEATTGISEHLRTIGQKILADEMDRYKASLESIGKETAQHIGSADAEIASHQQELRTQLSERQAEIDAALAEHQRELEKTLAERGNAIELEFKEMQADYAKRQAALEASLTEREAELAATLRNRETELAEHQTALEVELTDRQQAHVAKQSALEAQLEQEMASRREAYIKQIDTKLTESVTSFLVESLGQHVDLGAQTAYLTSLLETHKQELIEGLHE